jgi:hypothetical protein
MTSQHIDHMIIWHPHVDAKGGWGQLIGPAMLLIIQWWWWYVSLKLWLKLVVVAHIAFVNVKGGMVMEARGKQRDVAVQCEALEFLASLDLDLSSSNCLADQKARSSWNQGTINVLCLNVYCTVSIRGQRPFKDLNFVFLTIKINFVIPVICVIYERC